MIPNENHINYMRNKILLFSLSLSFLNYSAPAQIVTIGGWDFNGLSAYGASPLTPSTTAANVTIAGWSRGSGVTTSGTAAANAWGGTGWDGTAMLADAVTRGDFASFSVTVGSGYSLSIDSFSAYNIRRTSTAATTGQWQYSLNGTSFSDIGSAITWGATTTSAGNAQSAINLSGISALQNVAAGTTVTFRVVNYGATGSTGAWYLNNFQTGNDFSLLGSLSAAASAVATWAGNGSNGGTWQNGIVGKFSAPYTNANNNSVEFSGTSEQVTVVDTVQAGSLAFKSGGFTLNSGSINLGVGAIATDTGTTTINSVMNGTSGLNKTGSGILILNGANMVSGGVGISAGTLQINNDTALGDMNNDIVNNGTLKTTANVSLLSSRDLSGSGILDIAEGSTLTFNGSVNNSATTLASSGTLDL